MGPSCQPDLESWKPEVAAKSVPSQIRIRFIRSTRSRPIEVEQSQVYFSKALTQRKVYKLSREQSIVINLAGQKVCGRLIPLTCQMSNLAASDLGFHQTSDFGASLPCYWKAFPQLNSSLQGPGWIRTCWMCSVDMRAI